jgi:N6-adenosine-specific RNA methylase IME4
VKFKTILADPPWQYSSRNVALRGTTDHHYETMRTDALMALPVKDVVDDHAVLLLWATWPHLPDALRIIEAWGFTYVTAVPWFKTIKEKGVVPDDEQGFLLHPNYGVGYWFRGCSEPLLLAKRPGTPAFRTNLVGIISPNATHSRKPDQAYDIAERFDGPYLELFARVNRLGWVSLGNEVGAGRDIRRSLEDLRAAQNVQL